MSRRARARGLAVVAAIAACHLAKSARSADAPSIAWDAPAECPDRSALTAAIQAWLDPSGTGSALAAVRVEATVRPEQGAWRLDLRLEAPGGSEQQSLVAARCDTLVQVVALKVALATAPTTLLRSLDEARTRTAAEPGRQPAIAAERGPRLAIRGTLGAGLGPLPEPSGFASLGGSVELPGWRLEIAGAAWLPRSVSYPELPSVGAHLRLLTGSVRGCLVPKMGAIDFPICAGAEIGVLQGSGFGVARVETSDELWAAALVGPALRWTLGGSTSLWIAADAVLGIDRPAFHMRNLDELYRPEAITARTWVGLEVRL